MVILRNTGVCASKKRGLQDGKAHHVTIAQVAVGGTADFSG